MRFNLYEVIGRGGYGNVYKSALVTNNEVVGEKVYAVKKLNDTLDNDAFERFKREVRILKLLNHPNIVKIITENLEGDEPFYVMPLYKGNLRSVLDELNIDYSRMRVIFNSIFDGIEYLHNEGVYHRDLKPENILINSDTDLVINDFGLGLKVNSEMTRLTCTGMGMGTYNYMAPEQLDNSKNADNTSDIYSIGKILFECVVGTVGISVDINLVPQWIKYVIRKCLEHNPEKRFSNIDELRQAFNASLDIVLNSTNTRNLQVVVDTIVTSDDYENLFPELVEVLTNIDLEKEKDNIHNMIMKVPTSIIMNLVTKESDLGYRIIEKFVENITTQAWPFNYTDDIGDVIKKIFYSIDNVEVKANLIYCVGEVGIHHNRWYVIGIFRDMLESIEEDNLDLAFSVITELNRLNKELVKRCIEEYNLHPIIKNWIEKESEMLV